MTKALLFHFPACPFSQRIEIWLTLAELSDTIEFHEIDITEPRPTWLLAKTGGSTTLPVLELPDGKILKDSMLILQHLEDQHADHLRLSPIAQREPSRRRLELRLTDIAQDFAVAGYVWLLNQDFIQREVLRTELLKCYAQINDFLTAHSPTSVFLFDRFGWAETVFAPLFVRFQFLAYYENFQLPNSSEFARVSQWERACLAHPAVQSMSKEQVVKLYYDYAKGVGNGQLVRGRMRSSFALKPNWSERPWPSCDKYRNHATDAELGLLPLTRSHQVLNEESHQ